MSTLKNFLVFARTYAGPVELFKRALETLIGYLIYPIAYLFPRNKKKWVFGTNVGFTDNAKYLYLYTLERNEVRAMWITNKKDVINMMRSLNLEVYHKWSPKGLWHCLTAGMYIFTSHSNDINFFTVGRAKKIELWHGVGIKGSSSGKDGKKRDEAIKSFIYKITAPHNYEKFDLFLSTGPLMNEHFTKMFNLEKGVLFDSSYPRCNFLQQPMSRILDHIRLYETPEVQQLIDKFKQYDNIYLYMPTWRADMKDSFLEEAKIDFDMLNEAMLQTNSLFLFKLHPAVRHHKDYTNYDSILFLDSHMDVYSILPFTTTLITDYSSIYYDYLLMDKKDIILFPFDYEEYITNSKSLAFDFDKYTPGVRADNFKDLIYIIKNEVKLEVTSRDDILRLFWGDNYLEKSNNESLYSKIKQL
jgi:CDP-glycerol glycerophosphotransferase (TagB/SpsB family)